MIEQDQLADWLLRKYPQRHSVHSDKTLYDYVLPLKETHLRKSLPLNKVAFDSTLKNSGKSSNFFRRSWLMPIT